MVASVFWGSAEKFLPRRKAVYSFFLYLFFLYLFDIRCCFFSPAALRPSRTFPAELLFALSFDIAYIG